MKKHYEVELLAFTLRGETTVIITGENEYGNSILVAHYDFNDNGYKFYNSLQGKEVEVSRISTILNYLFKNGLKWWSSQEIETARSNWVRIKKDTEKAHKLALKAKDDEQALHFIEKLKELDENHVKICEKVLHHDGEKLKNIIQQSYKHASKKNLQKVYEAIREYEEGQ